MSNAVSPLKGASQRGYATVSDAGPQGMITLRGNLSDAKIKAAVKKHTGTDCPDVRTINRNGAISTAWMSPDELLILCAYRDANALTAAIQKTLGKTHSLVANVSDARAQFTVTGADVREVLAKLTPADVSAGAFSVGEVRRSRLAQVAGAFWLDSEDQLQVICFRSVAQYVFDVLKTSSTPGGQVGYF